MHSKSFFFFYPISLSFCCAPDSFILFPLPIEHFIININFLLWLQILPFFILTCILMHLIFFIVILFFSNYSPSSFIWLNFDDFDLVCFDFVLSLKWWGIFHRLGNLYTCPNSFSLLCLPVYQNVTQWYKCFLYKIILFP